MIKGIDCHLKYALSYPFPPYLPITLEKPLSIKHELQAIESRLKAEFLFHGLSRASLVSFFLSKDFLKMQSLITCSLGASDEFQVSTMSVLACDFLWKRRV